MIMQRALLLVEAASVEGFRGRLVDDRLAQADWVTVEVRFGRPPKEPSMSLRDLSGFDSQEKTRREAFSMLSKCVRPSSLIRLDHARGEFDAQSKSSILAAYDAVEVCSPAETAQVLALPHTLPLNPDDGTSFWHQRDPSEFYRRVRSLVAPEWKEGKFWSGYLRTLEFEGECAEAEARHQPNEALVYVLDSKIAVLLQTHGAYLFYADGSDCQDAGIRHLPRERGIYYVTGQPWGYGPDINGEYDSGFDVAEAVPATAEHFAIFGASGPEAFAETMAEYDAEFDAEQETVPVP
ncbi:hypothetical protein ACVIGB_000867 [Bradyrhizobium sp. USDA 4341]